MQRLSRRTRLTAGLVTALALGVGLPSVASAHIRLTSPPPISDTDDGKESPCGCVFGGTPACPGTFPTTTLTAGEQITVSWVETVNHAGSFRLSIVPSPVDEVLPGLLDAAALPEIPDENDMSGATITATITVPSQTCESCTLQLRQFMQGAADPYYFACASVRIVEPGGTTTSGAGGGGVGGAGGSGATNTSTGPQGMGGAPVWEPEPLDDGCSASAQGAPRKGALGFGLLASALAGLALARRRRAH